MKIPSAKPQLVSGSTELKSRKNFQKGVGFVAQLNGVPYFGGLGGLCLE